MNTFGDNARLKEFAYAFAKLPNETKDEIFRRKTDLNTTKYDKVETQANPLHWKKKKGGEHKCGLDLEAIIPKEGEIRLLGNRSI